MSTMNNGDSWNDAITIDRASGVKVTIDTDGKYIDKDIELTINVQPGSAATPNTTITANPTLSINSSTGVVTGTVSTTKSVTPTVSAGYVSTGSAGTMTVSGSNTLSLATQAAQTITPGTANQTIAAGKYLTGAQTIAGDSNLVAENIAEGVSIFGVTGTHSGGGGGATANAVNFRDYDGTIVQSYSAADFATLTAMPANPSHDGLTAQGWNWTLANAQAYVAKYGRLDIGQMYITDDGKTRVYIHLEQGRTSPMLGCCPKGIVDVDWGDGTEHDRLTGNNVAIVKWTPTHNYAAPGDYVIQLTVTGTGSMGFMGSSSVNQYSGLLRYTSGADSRNSIYRNTIQRVEIGSGVTGIGNYAFSYCYSLASITIPDNVSFGNHAFSRCYSLTSISIPDRVNSIGDNTFSYCYSLASITIPDNATSISRYAFESCYSLASVSIPDRVTSIADDAFESCYSLASITIPDNVGIGSSAFVSCSSLASITIPDNVDIGSHAFTGCYGISEYHFASTTPPTLANANAFTSISADCIMYVPVGSLEAYQTATNWSNYASYMREEDT